MSNVENCENCAFGVKTYRQYGSEINCHFHAPIVFVGVVGLTSTLIGNGPEYQDKEITGAKTAWPEVKPTDFCGDFELKDAS